MNFQPDISNGMPTAPVTIAAGIEGKRRMGRTIIRRHFCNLFLALELETAEHGDTKARLVKFGEIEVEGKRYTHDVVIDGGKVRKRKKGPSKQFREKFGHTPLSAGEEIPWGGKRLIVGTGAHGALPVMDEVLAEAKRRGIEVISAPTSEVCELLEEVKKGQAYAILHCTC